MNSLRLLLVMMLITSNHTVFAQNISTKVETLDVDKKTNCNLRYYYYPNLQAYFDKLKKVFYFQNNGSWQIAESLPENYGGYSLYKMNHVMITDFDDDEPYQFLNIHKKQFPYNFKGAKL